MNALQVAEDGRKQALRVVLQELARSYVLAGQQDRTPPIAALSETAGAIVAANEREPRPVPNWLWGDLFQFTRRKWALCGFGELMRAWEGEEFREWQAERRKAAEAAKPKPAPAPREPVQEITWEEVWKEAWEAGEWVPASMEPKLREMFGQRKNLC